MHKIAKEAICKFSISSRILVASWMKRGDNKIVMMMIMTLNELACNYRRFVNHCCIYYLLIYTYVLYDYNLPTAQRKLITRFEKRRES